MKPDKKNKILQLTVSAAFTALICVMSQIAIPMPSQIPITLQTFAVALCGYLLGAKWGAASISAYILLGAVGVPVFSGFKGGVQAVFGMTGGFIYGFVFLVVLCGLSLPVKYKLLKILLGLSGLALCHFFGVIQFAAVYKTSILSSFLLVSAPYLAKDAASLLIAFFVSIYLKRRLPGFSGAEAVRNK